MKDLLETAAKCIGVASFAVLFITVVHEWGYFLVLGPHLLAVATTYDYLANALVWLPAAIGAVFSLQALDYAISIKDGKIKLGGVFYFGWAGGVVGIALYLLFGGMTASFAFITFLGSCLIFFLARDAKGNPERLSNYRLLLLSVYLTALAYGYGVSTAYSDLGKSTDIYSVEVKDSKEGASTRVRQLVLLRIFEKGLLVRDLPAQRIEFLRWESINAFSKLMPTPVATKGYLCTWYGMSCGKRGAEVEYEP
jgi:hypothetical protein